MPLADLLSRAAMLSAPLDTTDLATLRALVFARLRSSGWSPSGAERGRLHSIASGDEALLAALVRGEAEAFDVLFERHAAQLNGYARRWLQGADAADTVQDAFLVLFEKAQVVLGHKPVNVRAYLFAVLRHKMQHLQAVRLRQAAPDEAVESMAVADESGLTALLRREDAERLARLLNQVLNPLEQEVVTMAIEDRDGPEIASELGITPGHARVLRHRALGKLRRAFEDEQSQEDGGAAARS